MRSRAIKLWSWDEMRPKKQLNRVLNMRARMNKLLIKDAKLRTFIAQDEGRDDMVAHVYDITYGTVVRGKDNVIVIDDSIVGNYFEAKCCSNFGSTWSEEHCYRIFSSANQIS